MRIVKEAAEASLAKAHATSKQCEADVNKIQSIPRPKGEAGDRKCGFNLREAMKLGGDENKELFLTIEVYIISDLVPWDFFYSCM